MFEVIFENQKYFQWASDFIFSTYDDAEKYLRNEGFNKASNGFESSWDSRSKAYITPKKIYKI